MALGLVPSKIEQFEAVIKKNMLVVQNSIGEAVLSCDQRFKQQLGAVIREINQTLKQQYNTSGKTIVAMGQASSSISVAPPAPEYHVPDLARGVAQVKAETDDWKLKR